MAGSNNFLQWNPGKSNQMSDGSYNSNTIRSGGAQSGDVCPSAMDNKFRYQMSTFIKAFGDMMSVKGFTVSDSDVATLATVFANILTTADNVQADWDVTSPASLAYILHKPTIPAAQVDSDWDSVTSPSKILNKPTILTVADDFASSMGTAGYQKLPSGLIIQWGNSLTTNTSATTITFPISFVTACYSVTATPQATQEEQTSTSTIDTVTKTSFAIHGRTGISCYFYWIAIGQ